MHYTDFIKLARLKGFENPGQLYMTAYHLGLNTATEAELEPFLNTCSEEESIWNGIYEYRINGKVILILDDGDANRVVNNYRDSLKQTMEGQSNQPSVVTCKEMADAYYDSIFDVFDTVQEVELEIDGFIFPKYYIVEC